MFSDSVSFNGGTRVEVIAVLANCGRDIDKARRALVTWIRHKQDKGRSTEHILAKLRDIESKFIKDTTLHCAFRDARAETCLPRAPDLPLPSSLRRASNAQSREYASTSEGRSSLSSSLELPAASNQSTSPPVSPLRLSRDSSKATESRPGNRGTLQRTSLPQSIPHVPHLPSPRIQIPHPSIQPVPSSPTTSSPEEPDRHPRYSVMSQPVGPTYQSKPVSVNPPEFLRRSLKSDPRGHSSIGLTSSSSICVPIPRSRSQRSVPYSPPTSSDESEFRPTRYRPMSQPVGSTSQPFGHMSPGLRRITPPSSGPPDVPLPPIPSDQSMELESDQHRKTLPIWQPRTSVRSFMLHPSTPVRPLPIQPIPSPVPGSDESGSNDALGEDSLRQNWEGSTGDLPSDIVVRKDSPVYAFHDNHDRSIGDGPPPPYADQLTTHFPSNMPTIDGSLVTAVNRCGGSPQVRFVVSKCIEFHRGYEPPYWQSRLQACGLDVEEAKYLVDEMSKQVDWSVSFRKST